MSGFLSLLQLLYLAKIACDDWKTKTIDLEDLGKVAVLLVITTPDPSLIPAFFLLLTGAWALHRAPQALGAGDVILATLLTLAIPLEQLGPFLIITGMGGILTRSLKTQSPQFPLAPALVLAYYIIKNPLF